MAERVFTKVQYGKESAVAHGTGVAATKMWLGSVKVPSDRKPVYPPYNLGLRARSTEGHFYQYGVDGLTLSGPDNGDYFQMLPLLFSLFFKGAVTAAETTSGQHDYKWTFTPSLTASNALDSATIEYGDNFEAYKVQYVTGKRLTLSGAMGQDQTVKASLECFGDQIQVHAFTGALTKPATTQINANLSKLYVDALWANKGTTLKAAVLNDWSVEFLNGCTPGYHGNSLVMDSVRESYLDFLLTLTLERSALTQTLMTAFNANPQTPMAFAIKVPGPAIGSGGTHLLDLSFWGVPEQGLWMDSEVNGANLDKFVIHSLYATTGAAEMAVELTTDINAV
jgi:hypothetical protein